MFKSIICRISIIELDKFEKKTKKKKKKKHNANEGVLSSAFAFAKNLARSIKRIYVSIHAKQLLKVYYQTYYYILFANISDFYELLNKSGISVHLVL